MKKLLVFTSCCLFVMCGTSKEDTNNKNVPDPVVPESGTLSEQNLVRAMQIADSAMTAHFTGSGMAMARFYNPYTGVRSTEKGSIWMYTSAIEAVNTILHALNACKEHGKPELYNAHFARYVDLLARLYDNADYYLGTFTHTSYTQTRQWSVHGVDRAESKGAARVEGIYNVYDDQQWVIRELVRSYKITGEKAYLDKAEYLTEYVLDGWDCTRDASGNERGGITWGPGYVSKHSCSNGSIVSPLVWLHEIYKGKDDEIEYRYIDANDKKTRRMQRRKKADHYLDFSGKIYAWLKQYLLRADGVYDDLIGGCTPDPVATEVIDGVTYRQGIDCPHRVGPAYSYNSGAMISGAADLYRVTSTASYLVDAKKLSDNSFSYFAKLGATVAGYYTYDISGFNNCFNGVLLRGYLDVYPTYKNVAVCINSFQQNLDYAYSNFFYKGFLPTNLLLGWSRSGNENNNLEGMFTFTFAAEYAVLAQYELGK
ncbi:MAG: glycoside hydrolase family 76 protein [Prevotellaceae bacterium]|nr:glycoside hydrolase family 76 protein [Prevotellaceae bacterium]